MTVVPVPPAAPAANPKRLRIGIDVGGTNTDGVILDPSPPPSADNAGGIGIVAWHKAATTAPDPGEGIGAALAAMLASARVDPAHVACVTIGTTHFVNAVVERDPHRLAPVAVLRLSGPFGRHAPPCLDWPADMRDLVLGYHATVPGGLEVDGRPIAELDEEAVRRACREARARGLRSVAVVGTFSPIDTVLRQEERAAAIAREEMPGCDVVLSRDVANLGFLERENAAILNAAILPFARRTIRAFQDPVRRLGLDCPVFVTQNDGTLLAGDAAARLPIRTFSSGPTNSMRGAAVLARASRLLPEGSAAMVVDVGGTTADVGLLLPNGFPRQQAAYSELAGVRMNFSCPDIKSIGLGGGSIVRRGGENGGKLTVGPDSVGYRLTRDARVFGGEVLTATDCAVAAAAREGRDLGVGDGRLVEGVLTEAELQQFRAVVRHKLERVVDTMKTSPEDVPVLLVGGGAVIAPDELRGASCVLKPRWAGVANAIGAATAGVSAVVDTVRSTEARTTQELLEEISREAVARAVAAGAAPDSVKVVEMETLPLQYIANKTRFIVRAAGDFDFTRTDLASVPPADDDETAQEQTASQDGGAQSRNRLRPAPEPAAPEVDIDIDAYRPRVRGRVWYLSETDLAWITTGCYILGTGGGGSPYPHMLRLRAMLRDGAVVRVVHPRDLRDDDQVGCGGGAGSPTVGIEKLAGDEMLEAQHELYRYIAPRRATHMICIEIGGGNGLQGLILGAGGRRSRDGTPFGMDLPVVDGDWMGRAYPTKWQTTPVVFNERPTVWSPIAASDGNGTSVVMPRAASDLLVERVLRAALSQMGSHVGCAEAPLSGAETRRWVVENTLSQSWRIGRAVAQARAARRVDEAAEAVVAACGGERAARVLWKGKIVGVERTLRNGHVYGECLIEGADVRGDDAAPDGQAGSSDGSSRGSTPYRGLIKIPFKNENIAALRVPEGTSAQDAAAGVTTGRERQEDVLAIVPDLIAVLDAQNGEAIGTPEYRYGLLVVVLGIAASDRWTGSERGIEIGGPRGFDIHHLDYQPLGTFVKPQSVIDEFDEAE